MSPQTKRFVTGFMRQTRPAVSFLLILLSLLLPGLEAAAQQSGGRLLWDLYSFYPRILRLEHNGTANGTVLVSVVTNLNGNWVGAILQSTNNGQTFTHIGSVNDPAAAGGMCCHTLYELPRAVGPLPAGTLLWAASFGADTGQTRRMSERVWKSTDQGRTWTFLSTIHTSTSSAGTWEPEFTVSSDGRLVAFFSDETDPLRSQKLVKARSIDGVTWTDLTPVVSSTRQADRPGMAVVRKVQDGRYLMSYEICSSDGVRVCEVYVRHSLDGWNWGDPANLGLRVKTADGKYPASTPTLVVSGNTVLLNSMRLRNADGSFAAGDGRTFLGNSTNGEGTWFEVAGPISLANPGGGDLNGVPCTGYSNPLLPSADGKAVLVVATAPNAAGHCRAYVAASTLAPIGSGSLAEASPLLLTSTQRHYFARSASNSLRHWWWTSGGSVQRDSWGENISGAPVAFLYGTQQHAFARTTLGGLAHAFWDSKDGVFRSDTWATGLASAPSAMVIGDAQHVWAVDTAGNLQQWWWNPAQGSQRNTWLSGVMGRPSVMLVNGVQHVFARTPSGAIQHGWWSWQQGMRFETFGASFAGDPVVAQFGDAQHVWGVDGSGNLRHWWWNPNQGWQNDVWGSGVAGRPSYMQVGDAQHVFARSTTGGIKHWWWNPTQGMQQDVWGATTSLSSDPTAHLLGSEQHVFATDSAGALQHWWWSPTGGLRQESWGL